MDIAISGPSVLCNCYQECGLHSLFKGEGLHLFPRFFLIKKTNIYKCCCKHVLDISKVSEALEYPFQSYGAF